MGGFFPSICIPTPKKKIWWLFLALYDKWIKVFWLVQLENMGSFYLFIYFNNKNKDKTAQPSCPSVSKNLWSFFAFSFTIETNLFPCLWTEGLHLYFITWLKPLLQQSYTISCVCDCSCEYGYSVNHLNVLLFDSCLWYWLRCLGLRKVLLP